jgi:hypothetical protein
MLKTRSAIFIVIALSLLLPAMAVADVGQYLILSAQYGNQWRHIDVTNRLKQLAATDQRYRVSYKTFGDPAPGQAKSLRIYARGPNGREQMFEYRDGDVIDGTMFIGWGTGQWGGPGDRWSGNWNGGGGDVGQYMIITAQYGNARRHIDVTDRLKQLAASNARYRVDYKVFGDPAPGEAKSLRIYARGPGGREQMFEYRDGDIVDGSMFTGWSSGQWGNDRWNGRWDVR